MKNNLFKKGNMIKVLIITLIAFTMISSVHAYDHKKNYKKKKSHGVLKHGKNVSRDESTRTSLCGWMDNFTDAV